MPAYKSYCWSLGTTSFRTTEFNRKIELQLQLLEEFWNLPQYRNENWCANNNVQIAYYNFLKEKGFIEDKDAPRKAKDAREKTSGLVDLGLITSDRRLTEAGKILLEIALSADFSTNNILQIPADSYLYLNQLLKLSYQFEDDYVRPYAVLAYILTEFGSISKDEFVYLLPLVTNKEKLNLIISLIRKIRAKELTVEQAIENIIFDMPNYKEAKAIFISSTLVNESLLQEIGMNRKSRDYDSPYFQLYASLHSFKQHPDTIRARNLFESVKCISGKSQSYWKKYLFKKPLTTAFLVDGASNVKDVAIFNTTTETEFRAELFRLIHLFKAKSLLDDYYDLNKRYFKTSDTVIFEENCVKFDIIPSCYFSLAKDALLKIAFSKSNNLFDFSKLQDLGEEFNISNVQLFAKAEELYGVHIKNLFDIKALVESEKYERFNKMIDEKFTDENIVNLMTMFENRDDNDIRSMVTNNADVPTIFEYVLAIAWYKISGRQGKVLEYMNLSLDSDLLPITHAAGGHEDITYKYEATENYPAHTLLIEATLANSTNQRRMEMEPVSRHLGDYLLSHDEEAYCVFATTYLHINVIADFRSKRKDIEYYSSDGSKCINSMKIIPCETNEIKTIIQKGITYTQLYSAFDSAFKANIPSNQWYEQEIVNKL